MGLEFVYSPDSQMHLATKGLFSLWKWSSYIPVPVPSSATAYSCFTQVWFILEFKNFLPATSSAKGLLLRKTKKWQAQLDILPKDAWSQDFFEITVTWVALAERCGKASGRQTDLFLSIAFSVTKQLLWMLYSREVFFFRDLSYPPNSRINVQILKYCPVMRHTRYRITHYNKKHL